MSPAVRASVMGELGSHPDITLCDPLSYEAFVAELASADLVLTDSGGVQERPGVRRAGTRHPRHDRASGGSRGGLCRASASASSAIRRANLRSPAGTRRTRRASRRRPRRPSSGP
ncbi:MAG: UDP-N-acetylglucosamine 2-epimerase [Solirubrobacteraceae bacterium]